MLDWLRERRDDVIGFREIVQFGPAPVLTKGAAEEALSILMVHGWVVEASARPRKLRLMGRYDFPWLIATSYSPNCVPPLLQLLCLLRFIPLAPKP